MKLEFFPARTVLSAAFVCALGSMSTGFLLSYPSSALPSLRADPSAPFRLTAEEESWIGGVGCIGAFAIAPVAGFLAEYFGRKLTIMLAAVPLSAGWLLIIAARNAYYVYGGRLLTGAFVGVVYVCVPCYIAEVAPTRHRGMLLTFHGLLINFGVFVSDILGIFLSWRWLPVAYLTSTFIMIFLMCFLPETPRWLVMRGRRLGAQQALRWFRASDDVTAELANIEDSIRECAENAVTLAHFGRKQYYYPFVLCIVTWILHSTCGYNVIWTYTVVIFQSTEFSMEPHVETAIVGASGLFGILLAVRAMDVINRRSLIVFSCTIMAISMAVLGAYFKLLKTMPELTSAYLYWLPLTTIILYTFTYTFGWISMPSSFSGELLPDDVRAKAGGLLIAVQWLGSFLMTKYFINMVEVVDESGVFWIFSAICLCIVIFTISLMPETRGKSLEEIEHFYQKRLNDRE